MKELICDKCGKAVGAGCVFCPDCGAALFHSTPAVPSAPPPEHIPPAETPQEETPTKSGSKRLVPAAAMTLAILLSLILGWDTLSALFSEGEPQPSQSANGQSTSATQPASRTDPTGEPSVLQYNMAPNGYFPFVFDGVSQPYPSYGPKLDLNSLKKGCLYVHDQKTDQVYQITDQPVGAVTGRNAYALTQDHIYYVSSRDTKTVIRSDYFGQERTVAYRSENREITWVDYYGTNPKGTLVLVEDTNRVVMYDISTGKAEVVMEMAYITAAEYGEDGETPCVTWYGKEYQQDEDSCYYYYPKTGKNVKAGTNPTEPEVPTPTQPPRLAGWSEISPDREISKNQDGFWDLELSFWNYFSNGFILGSTGEDFLSLHTGQPVWVEGHRVQLELNPEGEIYYALDFVWCSYAGEVGIISDGDLYVYPVVGSDRYAYIPLSGYSYLLDLQTMELIDPFAQVEGGIQSQLNRILFSPNGKTAIVAFDHQDYLLEIDTGKMTLLTELSGLENIRYSYYVNQNTLALVDVFDDEYPQEWRANGYLYSIPDGTAQTLYTNEWFGWLIDSGGIEHFGRLYACHEDGLAVTDCITGKQTLTGLHNYDYAWQCGIDSILVEAWDHSHSLRYVWLVHADGTVVPLVCKDISFG